MTYAETAAPRYAIGKVRISAVTMDETLRLLDQQVQHAKSAYVCVTNVRTTILAQKDEEFKEIQNNSFLTLPDGMPLVWYAKLSGYDQVNRVSGLDLMKKVLSVSATKGYSHVFYGSTPEILGKIECNLKQLYPSVVFKGFCSPPFRQLNDGEIDDFIGHINILRPSFLWVGLGAPKQESFMDRVVGRLDGVILIGVGLAFDYSAGTVHRAPKWIQNHGFEWLYRCIQQPMKARRFIIPFFMFCVMLIRPIAKRLVRKTVIEENNKVRNND